MNDLAVTANRSIEALQITVDHYHQVVESLSSGDIDGAQHLGLVCLTVADKAPDPRVIGRQQSAMLKILGEPRDIDRHGHGQAHGRVGHLPELGHGSRVRVGRQTPALSQLTSEITQLLLGQSSFQIGSGVNTRRGVRLGEDEVSPALGAENVMKGRLHSGGGRGISRNVPTQTGTFVLRPKNHGGRVPPNDIFNALLKLEVSGIRWLLFGRKRIDVRRVQ